MIEMMIAVGILAILVAIAAPSFREISLNNRSTSNVNALIADLSMARSEALKLARTVSIEAIGGNWNNGWRVFDDANGNGTFDAGETLVKEAGAVDYSNPTASTRFRLSGVAGAVVGSTAMSSITFGSMGQSLEPNDGARFSFCRPDSDPLKSTGIRVDPSGRAQSVRDINGLGLSCS